MVLLGSKLSKEGRAGSVSLAGVGAFVEAGVGSR